VDRRSFMAGCAGLALSAKAGAALAQSGPLTKIIYPFAPGGSGDGLCRVLAQHLARSLDRTIIVENRTGGDGLIAIKSVKGASPDGSTILVTTGPTMYLLPMVETEPSFNTARDFVPVSLLARFDFGIVAGPPSMRKTSCNSWRGSRRIRARPRSACRAAVPFRTSPVQDSERCSAFR